MMLQRMWPEDSVPNPRGFVYAIDESDDPAKPDCQAVSFLKRDAPLPDQKSLYSRILRFVEYGAIDDENILNPLNPRKDGILEFKCRGKSRLACFYLVGEPLPTLIITHGFKGRSNKDYAQQVEHAKTIRVRWLGRKQDGQPHHA